MNICAEASHDNAQNVADPTTIHPIAIVHPKWCDLAECGQDINRGILHDVYHRTAPTTWLAGELSARLGLCRMDNYDGTGEDLPTFVTTDLRGDGEATLEELEGLSTWLILRTAEFRKAIEHEGHR